MTPPDTPPQSTHDPAHSQSSHAWLAQENDIGQNFALFYLAHAAYLELRGSYKRAEAVFQAGLDRRALKFQCWQALCMQACAQPSAYHDSTESGEPF